MKITLIGLGICEGDLTLRAKRALDGAPLILARNSGTDAFKSLSGYDVRVLSDIFRRSRNFDTLNKNLAREVLKEAKTQDVCYCVDGSVYEDEACKIILSRKKDCVILDGVSKSANAYALSGMRALQPVFVSAYAVGDLKSCRAACVYDVDCKLIASEVKQKLSEIFGDERECSFVGESGVKKIKIFEIDRQNDYTPPTAVAVEEEQFLRKDRYDYADLESMIKLLRAPGGCPWDRAQTPESITKNTVEEAYELADAVERGDIDGIEEETGDVLLQAAFYAVMEEERGNFTGADAITRVVKKLIFRHSHIFGGDKASSEGEALNVWEKNKREEKGETTIGETLTAVPKNMPALMRAQKVGKRAAKCGFDFLSSVSAAEKLFEEVQEMVDCQLSGDESGVLEEAGDLLFAAVNTVRLAGVDCEEALKKATDKFIKRFVACENLILAEGKSITDITGDELLFNYYWEKAKNET